VEQQSVSKYITILFGVLAFVGLYLTSLYSYLLFHSLAEIFSIVVACGIFMVVINSRRFLDNNYLLFTGIAYLFIGVLDLIHTLGYAGMGVFDGYDTNLPTQLWIASRYIESLTLFIAPLLIGRKLKISVVFLGYTVAISLPLLAIFYWNIFPDCYVERMGLTAFKKISEYIISLILLASIVLLFQKRGEFDRSVLQLLVASIIVTMGSELAFTFYIHVYGFSNLVGHFLKIISFYLIYKAIIETGLAKPYNILFRNLKQNEEALQVSHHFLEIANRYTEMGPLLKEFVAEVKKFTGCAAVGIRILDEDGNIPYQAYQGFSQEFYESESHLSIKKDQCMCIDVITGETNPMLPFYTEYGSLYMNNTTRFLATASEEEKEQTRNMRNLFKYESVALFPIRIENCIIGLIHVADPKENMVPLERVEVLEKMAMQLGTAIQRLKLTEEVRKARDDLEQKVDMRAAELKTTNEQLQQEIIERKRTEDAVVKYRRDLQRLSAQLINAQEAERKQISRELHDEMGQVLTAIRINLVAIEKELSPEFASILKERLEETSSLVEQTLEQIRELSLNLRPSILDDLGLVPTLRWYANRYAKRLNIEVEFKAIDLEERLAAEIETFLYRAVQEALTNIAKHAQANRVCIRLERGASTVAAFIEDNGKGFDVQEVTGSEAPEHGTGLLGIRERIAFLGGSFSIQTRPGQGARLSMEIPLQEDSNEIS